jgi:hypothetical protein
MPAAKLETAHTGRIKPGNSVSPSVDFPCCNGLNSFPASHPSSRVSNSRGKESFHQNGLTESRARYTKRRTNRASIIPLVVRLFYNRPVQRPAEP